MSKLLRGDYVLGTKYKDGLSNDAWGIGFYDKKEDGRHYIKNSSGKYIRPNGYRKCKRIKASTGKYIWENQDQMYSKRLWMLVKELENELD